MKEVQITLDDATVAALEASVAAGEAASIEEMVELALGAWLVPGLHDPGMPTREEMYALALEAEADANATGGWYTAEEVLANVRKTLRE